MATFSDILKNLFFALVLLQVAPPLIKNLKKQYSNILENKTKVALIPIKGAITNSNYIVKELNKQFEDKEIKAILLEIDCPGGTSGSSQAIFNEIKMLKCQNNDKPIIAFVENLAASGGYYIASATDYIMSTPSAFIGSIGSYIAYPVFKKFIEQYKIDYEIIKSGEYKTVGNPLAEATPEQKEMLQNLSDNVYNQFVQDVASQRSKLPQDSKLWANGRIWTGQQALDLGLIDELGSQTNLIKVLKEKANIEGKIEWIMPKKNETLLQSLLSPKEDSDSSFSFFDKLYNKLINGATKINF